MISIGGISELLQDRKEDKSPPMLTCSTEKEEKKIIIKKKKTRCLGEQKCSSDKRTPSFNLTANQSQLPGETKGNIYPGLPGLQDDQRKKRKAAFTLKTDKSEAPAP